MKKTDLLGYIIGIVGIILAVVFYFKSKENRELISYIDYRPIAIINSEDIKNSPIRVFRDDSTEIKSDLYIQNIHIWSGGKLSIKKEHILEPITLNNYDNSVRILDVKIVQESREICDISLNPFNKLKNTIEINFDILEQNDGCTIQVLYEGNKTKEFEITGIVEGYGDVELLNEYSVSNDSIIAFASNIVVFYIFIIVFNLFWIFILRKSFKENHFTKTRKIITIGIVAICLSLFNYAIISKTHLEEFNKIIVPEWISSKSRH